jgi:hypothetical protein
VHHRWDVFLSYAREDQEEVAEPLYDLLSRAGLYVWIDRDQLKIGDSLRRRIDEGIAGSRFGVVILSPSFFAKEWPQRELDALSARGSAGDKVLLPVWHNVDHAFIASHSPLLAETLAASTEHGLARVADEILRVFDLPLSSRTRGRVIAKNVTRLARKSQGGFWYRAVSPGHLSMIFHTIHTRTISTRFSFGDAEHPGFEVLYLAENPAIAELEIQAHIGPGPKPPSHVVIVKIDVQISTIVDIADPSEAAIVGMSPQELTGGFRFYAEQSMGKAPTQEFGTQLYSNCPEVRGFLSSPRLAPRSGSWFYFRTGSVPEQIT